MNKNLTTAVGMGAMGLLSLVSVLPTGAEGQSLASPPGAICLEAESGIVTAPFVVTNGYIYQPIQTSVTDGGRAAYSFTITNAGRYAIQALVDAPGDADNSFFVNIDAEPEDPGMVWRIPITTGFERRTVSWQGNGTSAKPQFVPKVFELGRGSHQLIFRGRAADVRLERASLVKMPVAPVNLRIVASP